MAQSSICASGSQVQNVAISRVCDVVADLVSWAQRSAPPRLPGAPVRVPPLAISHEDVVGRIDRGPVHERDDVVRARAVVHLPLTGVDTGEGRARAETDEQE